MIKLSVLRLSSLFVLSLFLVGMFAGLVAAEETTDDGATDDSADDSADDSRKVDIVKKETRVMGTARAAARLEEARANFRERQTKLLEDAAVRCDTKEDAEACRARLEKRAAAVKNLDEKKVEMLEKFNLRREEVTARVAALREKAAFEKFKGHAKARVLAVRELKAADDKFKTAKKPT